MDIYIWGCNAFSARLLHILKGSPIKVLGFIEDSFIHEWFHEKPVYKPQDCQHPDIPIVIAPAHIMLFSLPITRMKNVHQFKEKIQQIKKDHQLPNPLLHPVALLDFLNLPFKKRLILFGMQGSGNVIFVHLFQDIQKIFFPFFIRRNKKSAFFEIMAREYMHVVQQVTSDAIHLQEGYDVRSVAWKLGTSHFNCKMNQEDCSIYTFATREHIALSTPMYHQIPSLPYLSTLKKNQFKLFYIMRNPLDIILSSLNKANKINRQTKEIDNDAFQATALWVIDQLHAWEPLISEFTILKYENLILAPKRTIKFIMKKLQVPAVGFIADWLWKKHAFKQLPNAFNKHFWQGGIGKWRQYFSDDQLMFLETCGMTAILENYDYLAELKLFKQAVEGLTSNLSLEQIKKRKRCFYGDEKTDTKAFLIHQHGEQHCTESGKFIIMSHDDKARSKLQYIFNNAYIQTIADAGAYHCASNDKANLS